MARANSTGDAGDAPVVLITGASRGIGAHLARGFAEAGFRLVLTSTSGGGFDLRSDTPEVLTLALDVRSTAAVEAVIADVVSHFGRLDAVIHNAGVVEREAVIWESDPDEWWNVMEVNVRGAYLVARAASAHMVKHSGGRIVMLNSGSGGSDSSDLSAYHASKSALARITNAVTLAGAQHHVLAFDLAPGVIRTDMTQSMAMHEGRTRWTDPADVVALALAMVRGELDAWAGRMVRAGTDDVSILKKVAASGLDSDARRLRWKTYGLSDPLS